MYTVHALSAVLPPLFITGFLSMAWQGKQSSRFPVSLASRVFIVASQKMLWILFLFSLFLFSLFLFFSFSLFLFQFSTALEKRVADARSPPLSLSLSFSPSLLRTLWLWLETQWTANGKLPLQGLD